jgi:hypothetical protein
VSAAGRGDEPTPAVRLPILVAGLIVLASASLAVWTLRRHTEELEIADAPKVASVPTVAPERASRRTATRPPPAENRPTTAPVSASAMPRSGPTPTAAPVLAQTPAENARPISPTGVPTRSTPPGTGPTTSRTAAAVPPPTALINVSPPRVKRGGTTLLDVHGTSLRDEHHAVILRAGHSAADVLVTRQKVVDPSLMQVLVTVAGAAKGAYDVVVIDGQGSRSNAVVLEVVH